MHSKPHTPDEDHCPGHHACVIAEKEAANGAEQSQEIYCYWQPLSNTAFPHDGPCNT